MSRLPVRTPNFAVVRCSYWLCLSFGQEKEVFIYRLVAAGTLERRIYNRQLQKAQIANHVVDKISSRRVFEVCMPSCCVFELC
jgi:hypothetical protein